MITREDVKNIALLSKLFVPEDEIDELTKSMQEIVEFADAINSATTADTGFDNINNLHNVMRDDTVKPSYPNSEIISNAPDAGDDHFLVRKHA